MKWLRRSDAPTLKKGQASARCVVVHRIGSDTHRRLASARISLSLHSKFIMCDRVIDRGPPMLVRERNTFEGEVGHRTTYNVVLFLLIGRPLLIQTSPLREHAEVSVV